jgi:hypothetical protein
MQSVSRPRVGDQMENEVQESPRSNCRLLRSLILSNSVTETRIYDSVYTELDSGSMYEAGDSLGDTVSYRLDSNVAIDEDETLKV